MSETDMVQLDETLHRIFSNHIDELNHWYNPWELRQYVKMINKVIEQEEKKIRGINAVKNFSNSLEQF